MRTPGIFIFGIVLAPCGWVLDLTSTVAPGWRSINNIPGESLDLVLQQGLWDICRTYSTSRDVKCNQPDAQYFSEQIIQIARGFMLSSLILNLIGIGVASAGVRCWTEFPNWTIAGIGGLLIFVSGVLCIIPVAWYTHIMSSITAASTDVRVGYCLVLGFLGGILEVLGGLVMSIGLCRRCGRRKRDGRPWTGVVKSTHAPFPAQGAPVPSISSTVPSSGSSVPYYPKHVSGYHPENRHQDNRSSNTYTAAPCDSDL